MLFSIAVLTLVSWASATPFQNIFQVLRTSPACPASPSVISRTQELTFQALGNGNKGAKLEDEGCESVSYRLKASDMLILSRIVLISDFRDATQEATAHHGLGRGMFALQFC